MRLLSIFKPGYESLTLDPCIPKTWDTLNYKREFRGYTIEVKIRNEKAVEKGVSYLKVNYETFQGNQIPYSKIKGNLRVEVIMGAPMV